MCLCTSSSSSYVEEGQRGDTTRTEDFRRLLQAGASVNRVDDLGKSALHHAVTTGSLDAVMLLLNYVADPIIHTVHGDDVLQYAALSGEIDIVEHLIIHITCKSPASRQADAYALLAAYSADYHADRELAINYFIKSISIGVQFPVNALKPA